MIRIIDLHKCYHEIHVLQGIHLEIQAKELLTIIGSDGDGISTLLRCMYFLERPDQGEIWIDNTKLLDARADVGAVFQHVNLFPNKTVLENIIDAYIVIQKQSKQVATLKSRSLLKQVGLLSQTHLYPQKLSIGQKRRIALAQVLACRPRIILFDNPTAELEEEDSTIIVNLIKQLHAEGITIIVGTKSNEVAEALGGRMVHLKQGMLTE